MKLLFLIPLIYFLTLFQTSFMVFFNINGYILNLVLAAVLVFNFLENQRSDRGLVLAVFGGFFLDIFSSGNLFGIDWLLLFIAISLFIKYVFKKHVQIPFFCK
ncbi:MAG: hypothetical protein AAB959_00430 [Patescibacteria group bacterium]